jgi:CO/xanthine dehydrogenase Mo-binding subunit
LSVSLLKLPFVRAGFFGKDSTGRDGDPEGAFQKAAKVIEKTYTAPFLAHNPMEPVNCYAHVTAEGADIYGPTQAPEFIMGTLSDRLGLPKEKIHIRLARMGGGSIFRWWQKSMPLLIAGLLSILTLPGIWAKGPL